MYAQLDPAGNFIEREGIPPLEHIQAAVNGFVEVIVIRHGIDMWVHDAGKLVGLDRNQRATMFAQEARSIFAGDYVAGTVVFTGGADDDGETLGLTDEQLAYVRQAARIHEIGFPGSGIWNMTGIAL